MTTKKNISICLIDDHQLIRDGIKLILNQTHHITLTSEFGNIESFWKQKKKSPIDVLLLDITLPDGNGLNEIEILKKTYPKMGILVLTMHDETQFGMRAMQEGAHGYITKDNASTELITAIDTIMAGKKYISNSFSNLIAMNSFGDNSLPTHHQLSKQEFNVFLALGKGESPTNIGKSLFISVKTVSTYRTRILDKLNLANNAEITKYCIKNELII
ncbi:DNA-binding response regulator [Candidatus Marinamargulisbacteria bacterium SCGC AG-414-C22]|nr:DNA-binding response regulator [Candidatus Marinamargulisbacteria bacterium SCGC AG-414-C22]